MMIQVFRYLMVSRVIFVTILASDHAKEKKYEKEFSNFQASRYLPITIMFVLTYYYY